MNKPTFEMTNELAAIRTSIETMPDMTPEEADQFLDQAITAYLGENMTPERVGKIVGDIQGTLFDADEIKAKAKVHKDYYDFEMKRATQRTNLVERIQRRAMEFMDVAGIQVIDGGKDKLAIQLNPPAVDLVDASLVPEAYWKTPEPILMKQEALADMKAGADIPGLAMTRGRRLVIK